MLLAESVERWLDGREEAGVLGESQDACCFRDPKTEANCDPPPSHLVDEQAGGRKRASQRDGLSLPPIESPEKQTTDPRPVLDIHLAESVWEGRRSLARVLARNGGRSEHLREETRK